MKEFSALNNLFKLAPVFVLFIIIFSCTEDDAFNVTYNNVLDIEAENKALILNQNDNSLHNFAKVLSIFF